MSTNQNEIISAFQLNSINSYTRGMITLCNFDQDLYKRINYAYYGIGGFEDGSYLDQYPAEADEDYQERQALASYDNIFQTEIDYKTQPVFSKTISREIESDRLQAFSEKSTRSGQDLSRHMSEVMNKAELNTTVFEIVTAPPGKVRDNSDMSILPYCMTITPLKCSGYYKDSTGDLVLLAWQTAQRDSNGTTYNIYNVWEKGINGEGYFYRVQGVADKTNGVTLSVPKDLYVDDQGVKSKPFPVNMYPVKMIETAIAAEITEAPTAKYNTISKQLRTAYNIDNMIVKGFRNVCFSPVVYNTIDGNAPSEAQIGDNNVLGYAQDLDAPARMKVEVAHFETQEEKYQAILESIRKQMDSYTQISDNSSGEARKEAGRKIIQYWKNVAKQASKIEKWIFDVIQANYVNSTEEVIINYSTDFSSLTPDVIIDNAASFIETFQLQGSEAEQLIYENTAAEVYGDDPGFADKLKEAFKQRTNTLTGTGGNTEDDENDDLNGA